MTTALEIIAGALALASVTPTPAAAQGEDRVAALEARLIAQENRIRALEEQLRQQGTVKPASPTSPAPPATSQVSASPAIKLRGRLQIDALLAADGGTPTGTQIRRFYLGAEGALAPGLRYQAEADFAGNRVSIQDAFVAYRASPSTEIVAGYFKPPNIADEMTSDVATLFLERSAFAGALAPGRRVGFAVHHATTGWGLRAGVFGDRAGGASDRDEGWLASARAHADLLPSDAVLHAAASAYYSEPGGDHLLSLSQRPETNRAPAVLATGPFAVDHEGFLGGELGYGDGPLTVQIESGASHHSGPSVDPLFWGWAAQVGWRLTGEERRYDDRSGVFGRVIPRNGLDAGGLGAVEAGLRVSHVDLEDDGIYGGRLTAYGAVLNWYPITRLRVAGNIIHAVSAGSGRAKSSQTLVTLRGGIDW